MNLAVLLHAENLAVALAFFILAAIALVAVFHSAFDDTLIQRIALSTICIGSISAGHAALSRDMSDGVDLAAIAGAAYAMECFRLAAKRRHHNNRKED